MELIKNPAEPEATDPKPAPQVNDVSAPTEPPAPPAGAPVATTPAPTEEKPEEPAQPPADEHHEAEAPLPKPVKPPKPPKQHGTGPAIFAAVLIVLGLGAMFTYAYLKSR